MKRPSQVTFVLVAGKVLLRRPTVHVLKELNQTNIGLKDSEAAIETITTGTGSIDIVMSTSSIGRLLRSVCCFCCFCCRNVAGGTI